MASATLWMMSWLTLQAKLFHVLNPIGGVFAIWALLSAAAKTSTTPPRKPAIRREPSLPCIFSTPMNPLHVNVCISEYNPAGRRRGRLFGAFFGVGDFGISRPVELPIRDFHVLSRMTRRLLQTSNFDLAGFPSRIRSRSILA